MKVIRGRQALVTGAASGIGRAIALALAREGADLYLIDINADGLTATAEAARAHGVAVATRICDLREPAAITATVAALRERFGTLHILVNNAGIAHYGPTEQMTAAQWNALVAVNLLAPAQLIRELLPLLAAQDEAHILNVCSIFGLLPLRKGAAYQMSKFGLVGLTQALRAEYARATFGVTALCPGFVRTPMIEGAANGMDRQIPAWATSRVETVAARAIKALRRNRGLVVISPIGRALWWLSRLSPGLLDWLVREGWRRKGRVSVGPG
jgi:3-oxoacyl-[acyl-carrier protein] reductase